MTADELDALWKDPAHWNLWSYRCEKDPRMIVPKRKANMGWTINSAHTKSFFLMATMLLLSLAVPLGIVVSEGARFVMWHFYVAIVLVVIFILALCKFFARKIY